MAKEGINQLKESTEPYTASDNEIDQQVVEKSNAISNPLASVNNEELVQMVSKFCLEKGMEGQTGLFIRGAFLAKYPKTEFSRFNEITGYSVDLSQEEIKTLEDEIEQKWRQPWMLYFQCSLCAMCAVVQGMDETVVNGAQIYYKEEFKLSASEIGQSKSDWLVGLINSAPYLCCALMGCWLTEPLNQRLGRRGVIFLSCLVAALASIWEGVAGSWTSLFLARLFLGLGIGSKSTTVPVYSAECSPALIRGALVMQWQVFTAVIPLFVFLLTAKFGIMLGYIVDAGFLSLKDSLAWRLMLGSTVIAPLLVCIQVYICPESPRWYIKKNRYEDAYQSFLRLRNSEIQAARDLFFCHVSIQAEQEAQTGRNLIRDLFLFPRVRRATLASTILMFMQQFCGVNVIAYYSSVIFTEDGGLSVRTGILASLGAGVINWIFALPAFFTIDTFGRRNLLLVTFPLMSTFLFVVGWAFNIKDKDTRLRVVAAGIYLFMAVYSPGAGPVPFTYAAEAFPLYIRDIGMSWATAVTWFFNFLLSITWPSLRNAFTVQGAFSWYAGWCIIGWFLVFFLVPETRGIGLPRIFLTGLALELEELDEVFSRSTAYHIKYQWNKAHQLLCKYILQRGVKQNLSPSRCEAKEKEQKDTAILKNA